MANKMLIDASHPEETRVVVLRGNRVEEFDFESASKKQLRGNIYLAKVTRVEPSLQAAFVDYGGNRHGFLAFSEIHPDYYQIPVVDRQALIDEEAKAQRDEEDEETGGQRRSRRFRRGDRGGRRAEKRAADGETLSEPFADSQDVEADANAGAEPAFEPQEGASSLQESGESRALETAGAPEMLFAADEGSHNAVRTEESFAADDANAAFGDASSESGLDEEAERAGAAFDESAPEREASFSEPTDEALSGDLRPGEAEASSDTRTRDRRSADADEDGEDEEEHVEQLGGDAMEEVPFRPQRYRKQYKIQEVIKRRQVLLVQVVKEERGNKGAALTTYLSLAGRYSVLMPNTARGGGISRKITDSTDRQRLKSIAQELEVPEGMGVILRTAGASRTKPEVKRDFEYLLRMWETVRETTLKSTAPMLVYEEGSLIKRAIRDLYNKDIDDIVVAGEKGFREARDFMRLLMPSHARSVQPYRDPQPIFSKSGVEAQLDAMFLNQVTLKSGGYIVINQTEALVAIDVNSGRSTREHNIEDTALRTNLEAADEVARQLRLRDLAGLIVVDFIDMEEGRNNRAVERRLKDALKNDRARIQVGRISHFGLLEMSRQRIRTGVLEGSTEICPHCSGSGMLRSTASIALHVLRVVEDALIKSASHDLIVKTRTPVALYILNEKRATLRDLERRFGVAVTIDSDDSLIGAVYHAIERGEPASGGHEPLALAASEPAHFTPEEFGEEILVEFEEPHENAPGSHLPAIEAQDEDETQDENGQRREGESESEADSRRRRRRRRRRGRGSDREGSGIAANAPQPSDEALQVMAQIGGLQPLGANAGNAFEGEATSDAEPESGAEEGVVEAPVETVAVGETAPPLPDAEAVPAKTGERRRSRRGVKARDAAAEAAAETLAGVAPELALEGQAQDAPAANAEAETEAAPPARRSRRAPRARAPRRAAAGIETATAPTEAADVSAAEGQPISAEGEAAPAVSHAPEALTEHQGAESVAEPVLDLQPSQGAPAAEAPASVPAHEPAEPEIQPTQEQDPNRPKRSGWWQRAKASLSR